MNYIISESQLRSIITEVKDSKFTNQMKTLNSFGKNVISKTQKLYGINLRFLTKWGSSIGGIVMPLDNWIRTRNFKLTDEQIGLLLIGVVCTFFFENRKAYKDLIQKIKEENLEVPFTKLLGKAETLKSTFFTFLESLNLTFSQMVEMISYSFLIPIIPDLLDISHGSDPFKTGEIIAERLLASGAVILTGTVLVDVITRILNRFSGKE